MRKDARNLMIILGIGVLYFIWLNLTDLGIPCLFHMTTGWLCPGCGITTLLFNLLHGNIAIAYHANPFLFVTMPLFIGQLFYYYYVVRIKKATLPKWNCCLVYIYGIALVLFGIYRNLI